MRVVTAGQRPIEQSRLLEGLGVEVELVTTSVHSAACTTPVPTCPGWTVREVLWHLGSVYRAALSWLVDGRSPRERQHDPAESESALEYLGSGFDALRTELAARAPDEHAASWWPADTTCGFWRRRMTHETTIHRVDIETCSAEHVSTVDEDIALDGIDEVLTLWFGQRLSMMGLAGTRDCLVAVRTGGHDWLARAGPGKTRAWRCSETDAECADVAVHGEPAEVYLWLWGRAAPGTVTVVGPDEDAAGQLWALLRLATR